MKPYHLPGCLWVMIVLCCSCSSCRHSKRGESAIPPPPSSMEESGASRGFLKSCRELKSSDGFRRNFYLCARREAYAAICMDLNRQLYVIVSSRLPARTGRLIHERFGKLEVSPAVLRSRMDPDAFILDHDNEPLVGIFRIPDDASETFGIELINHLLGLDLTASEQSFQWD